MHYQKYYILSLWSPGCLPTSGLISIGFHSIASVKFGSRCRSTEIIGTIHKLAISL